MKKLFLYFLFVIIGNSNGICQSRFIKIYNDYAKSTKALNDSIIVSKNSIYPYKVKELSLIRPNSAFDNEVDSFIFAAKRIGEMIGPFENDSIIIGYKIMSIDSAMVFHVGNIFIKSDSGATYDRMYAEKIINKYISGIQTFDELCLKYSMDNNKQANCDIDLIFEGYLLKDFEKEILHHKKDDVFITNTKFGTHVVKLLDDNLKSRVRVKYTSITMYKH